MRKIINFFFKPNKPKLSWYDKQKIWAKKRGVEIVLELLWLRGYKGEKRSASVKEAIKNIRKFMIYKS
jgi:hypothetical protein